LWAFKNCEISPRKMSLVGVVGVLTHCDECGALIVMCLYTCRWLCGVLGL